MFMCRVVASASPPARGDTFLGEDTRSVTQTRATLLLLPVQEDIARLRWSVKRIGWGHGQYKADAQQDLSWYWGVGVLDAG